MPAERSVYEYLESNSFAAQQYARAKEACSDVLADEILDVADEVAGCKDAAQVNAARLRVDARKWIASKLKPKKYGDRVDVEHSGSIGTFDALAEALKREKGVKRELPPMLPAVDPDDRSVTDGDETEPR